MRQKMTDIQEKLLELLTDIDTICKREDIKYYLSETTAHGAFMQNGFHPDCCEATVAMRSDDILRFVAAVEKENRSDRILDSMLTNVKYPGLTLRYGDPNTLLLSPTYNYVGALPCINVKIQLIRYLPKKNLRRAYKRSRKFWSTSYKAFKSCTNPFQWISVFFHHVLRRIIGSANLNRYMFKKWCNIFSSNKEAKKISVGVEKYRFTPDLLEYEDTIEFEGKQFPIFAYLDTYLRLKYGSSFRKKLPRYQTPENDWLVSPYVPFEEYLKRAEEMKVNFKAIRKNNRELDKINAKVTAYNKIIGGYYAIVDRTDKRFAMYETYMPMKKLLAKLHSEERFEELNELLKPYRSALWSCYKKGLGLCFDKEIFEYTMDILRREGSFTYVTKLRNMVPEEHWEPMVVTDYKGQIVEIEDISELLPEYYGEGLAE